MTVTYITGSDHRQTFTTTHHNNNNNNNNRCHYETLGVPRTASPEDVRNAYLEKTKLYHPDKNLDNENTRAKLLQVQEAYESLRNKKKGDVNGGHRRSSAGYGESRWPDRERHGNDRYPYDRYHHERYHGNGYQYEGYYGHRYRGDGYHHDRYRNREVDDERHDLRISILNILHMHQKDLLQF